MVSEHTAKVLVAALISKMIEDAVSLISPEAAATQILIMLDPNHAHDEIYYLAHVQLRQNARNLLNKKFGSGAEENDTQGELFELQTYYPQANGEPYVHREAMTDDDVAYNVARLRKEGATKLKHADALEAWGVERHWRK